MRYALKGDILKVGRVWRANNGKNKMSILPGIPGGIQTEFIRIFRNEKSGAEVKEATTQKF